MNRIVLIYGLIAGVIIAVMMSLTISIQMDMENGELVGYTTMVIALSMIFFGVKSFRDNQGSGKITFWKGMQIGLLITLVAGIIYALAWEVNYSQNGEEFTQKMTENYFRNLEERGASQEEIAAAKEEWASFGEMYKNPVIRFGVTLIEILPVGIVLSLLSAALLRNKEFLPASQST